MSAKHRVLVSISEHASHETSIGFDEMKRYRPRFSVCTVLLLRRRSRIGIRYLSITEHRRFFESHLADVYKNAITRVFHVCPYNIASGR